MVYLKYCSFAKLGEQRGCISFSRDRSKVLLLEFTIQQAACLYETEFWFARHKLEVPDCRMKLADVLW